MIWRSKLSVFLVLKHWSVDISFTYFVTFIWWTVLFVLFLQDSVFSEGLVSALTKFRPNSD